MPTPESQDRPLTGYWLRILGDIDTADDRRLPIIEALATLGPPAIPELIAALADPNHRIANGASNAIGMIGEAVIPALEAALSSPKVDVRTEAAQRFYSFALKGCTSLPIPALIQGLGDPDRTVRYWIATTLCFIRWPTPAVLPALERAIEREPEEDVRTRMEDAIEAIESGRNEAWHAERAAAELDGHWTEDRDGDSAEDEEPEASDDNYDNG